MQPFIASLRGKIPDEAVDAINTIAQQQLQLSRAIQGIHTKVSAMPTSADLQAQAAKISQALSIIPSYDLLSHGSSTGVKPQGSLLPTVNGAFAYTSTTSSITWYWDGTNGSTLLTIFWNDGSSTPVPPSSQLITGLANTTAYNFYPYYSTDLGTTSFATAAGGVGTPPAAFVGGNIAAATAQSLDTHVALNATTMTASTGGGGGSGGGSGGGCVWESTDVQSLCGRVFCSLQEQTGWCEARTSTGRKLIAVPNHRVFTDHGLFTLRALERGLRLLTVEGFEGFDSKRFFWAPRKKKVVWAPPHGLYWANGILSPNKKPL